LLVSLLGGVIRVIVCPSSGASVGCGCGEGSGGGEEHAETIHAKKNSIINILRVFNPAVLDVNALSPLNWNLIYDLTYYYGSRIENRSEVQDSSKSETQSMSHFLDYTSNIRMLPHLAME
jgi:hypothetical protein